MASIPTPIPPYQRRARPMAITSPRMPKTGSAIVDGGPPTRLLDAVLPPIQDAVRPLELHCQMEVVMAAKDTMRIAGRTDIPLIPSWSPVLGVARRLESLMSALLVRLPSPITPGSQGSAGGRRTPHQHTRPDHLSQKPLTMCMVQHLREATRELTSMTITLTTTTLIIKPGPTETATTELSSLSSAMFKLGGTPGLRSRQSTLNKATPVSRRIFEAGQSRRQRLEQPR